MGQYKGISGWPRGQAVRKHESTCLLARQNRNQIRNSKSEIRNKFKTQNPNVPNHLEESTQKRWDRDRRFEPSIFEFGVCFGFRASDFELPGCAHRATTLRTESLTYAVPIPGSTRIGQNLRRTLFLRRSDTPLTSTEIISTSAIREEYNRTWLSGQGRQRQHDGWKVKPGD